MLPAGLNAQPRTRSGDHRGRRDPRRNALQANATVVGSYGLTGIKSLLLGSVSHGLIQHVDRTVIVVPPAEVEAARTSRG